MGCGSFRHTDEPEMSNVILCAYHMHERISNRPNTKNTQYSSVHKRLRLKLFTSSSYLIFFRSLLDHYLDATYCTACKIHGLDYMTFCTCPQICIEIHTLMLVN